MGLTAYLGDDAARMDAAEYEAEVRSKDPRLLQSDERLVLAYRGQGDKGHDHRLFTSERYISRDKRGMEKAASRKYWSLSVALLKA